MWQNFLKDTVVSERPCKLHQVVVTPEDGRAGRVALYDGLNTNGRKIITIHTGTTTSKTFRFPGGLECSEGLYLECIERMLEVLVVWE